jgi:hypothetical protein
MEAAAPRRFVPGRLAAGFALTLVFLVAAGSLGGIGHAASAAGKAVSAVTTAASPRATTVSICHATGTPSSPYVLTTVSSSGLGGHGSHSGDLVPAPSGGCPRPSVSTSSSTSSSTSGGGGNSSGGNNSASGNSTSGNNNGGNNNGGNNNGGNNNGGNTGGNTGGGNNGGDDNDDPGDDQYKSGKGCGDSNHVNFSEGKCKNENKDKQKSE